jgi:hypothetical protein
LDSSRSRKELRVPHNYHHARYMQLLLDRTAGRRYPSHHMLERIEEVITDREAAEAYVEVILDEVEQERYPSHHMLERAKNIIVRMVAADEIVRMEREYERQLREAEREREESGSDE